MQNENEPKNNEQKNSVNKPTIKLVDSSEKESKGIFSVFKRLEKIKHIELILAGVAILIMLIIYFTSGASCSMLGCGDSNSSGGNQNQNTNATENALQRIERQLSEAFTNMEGAGNTTVIIKWESSIEIIIAYIISENQNSSSSAPQIITGGGSQGPLILKEVYPRAIGVLIMTEGGTSPRVQIEMRNAVTTLLDITPDRVQILTKAS